MKKRLAIIPARGGSKGIPKKNIYPVAGRPLIYYSIQAAKEAEKAGCRMYGGGAVYPPGRAFFRQIEKCGSDDPCGEFLSGAWRIL